MKNPIIVAAAFAAGLSSFAFGMDDSAARSLRADQSATAIPAKAKSARPATGAAAKAAKTCPYLFGCTEEAEDRAGPKQATKKSAPVVSKREAAAAEKGRRRLILTPGVDTIRTASIASSASAGTGRYSVIVARYAASYGVPVSLADAVIRIESNYRPDMTGSAGEVGLMQIKPATARMLGYTGSARGLYDPETNIKYGMKYLAMARDLGGGTTCGTILKYNAGHAATRMNPVSSAYCSKVKQQLAMN